MPYKLSRLWRTFLHNQTALLIALLLIGLTGIWALLANSAHEENIGFRTLLQKQVTAGIDEQFLTLGKSTRDYAVWDEFSEKINRADPDLHWLERNVTPTIYDNLDIDVALVVDPATRQVVYGMQDGKLTRNPKLIATLTRQDWQWFQSAMPHTGSTSFLTAMVTPAVTPGHSLYLIAIHPITPEHSNTRIPHGKLLLFARRVDQDILQQLSRSYHILTPEIVFTPPLPQPNLMAQPLNAQDGLPVAWLTWRSDPPGDALLRRLAPGALLLCVLLLALGLLLGQQARRLQSSQQNSLDRITRQGKVLRSLARNSDGTAHSLQALQNLCLQLAQTLHTERVGIWRHDTESQQLHCIAGADIRGPIEMHGVRIDADPVYLHHLEKHRFINIENLDHSANTSSFIAYAADNDFHSILDATIRVGKQIHGIISAECCRTRVWTQDEINFICSAADCVALMMESSARQAAEGELSALFYYDRATGLPNSHRLRLHLDTLTASRRARAGACVLMDLSNQVHIIDAYGPSVGEQMIAAAAMRIDALTRPGEMAARMGETRFALWLEGESEAELTRRLNHLQHALLHPFFLNDISIHPRFQIGVSLFPGDGHDAETLLEQASSAVQYAHKLNQQSWERFNRGKSDEHRERHRLQMDLREALNQQQLYLQYQPFIELATGRVIGCEALLRWTHHEKGPIAPGVFIPLAEEDDPLINAIGAWVLDQACAQIALWRRDYSSTLCMSINVSARQMEAPGFHQLVHDTLARHALPPQAIELEVTESIALSNTPELKANLLALQQQTVQLAIDDFGTGYASFSYLRRFPAARLKIDRQFFDHVPENEQNSNLVKMIVAMGHAMGAQVIGEGVESARQVAFLKQAGGDFAQGYFFSRPLDPVGMETFLKYGPYPVPDSDNAG